ncbi:hypothetical protein FRB99_005416 [Tulasnella sp. 403]|nr:hypothetical protein FRB99_005416 [Tulasnella sp. 403]
MGAVTELHNQSAYNPGPTDMRSNLSEDLDVLDHELATTITSVRIHPSSGEGHFCDLFMGMHPIEGMVVLKRPRISREDYNSTAVKGFLREARTWGGLDHPNILRFLGACKIDGFIHLVSPYMGNGTVMDFVKKHPRRVDRIALIRGIGSALEYLHAQSIIHGDLKGANILVSDDEHARLCDFGLSRMEHTNTSVTMKRAGTLRWQAPELWEDHPKSYKTDAYALAMTITEILTGDVPFRQYKKNPAVMKAVLEWNERPDCKPTTSSEGVSYKWVWRIAALCWHKDPRSRPLMSEVKRLLDHGPLSLHHLPPITLSIIFCQLSLQELVVASHVCKSWNLRINTDPEVWVVRLREAGLWHGGPSEAAWAARYSSLRAKCQGCKPNQAPAHPYKALFKERLAAHNLEPKYMQVPVEQHPFVPSRLLLTPRHIIVLSYHNSQIRLYSPLDLGKAQVLNEHKNGTISTIAVSSWRTRIPTSNHCDEHRPAAHYDDTLVTGYLDGSLRIWDLQTCKHSHTFAGHQSWVRCVAIARPVGKGICSDSALQRWPKHRMFVSGSWDRTLIIWRLPGPTSTEYHSMNHDVETALDNPYYIQTLKGHHGGVEAVAVLGNVIASGSHDNTVRIWDLITGECKYTLVGHSTYVSVVALDSIGNRVFAASAMNVVRGWSLQDGSALGVMDNPMPFSADTHLFSKPFDSDSITERRTGDDGSQIRAIPNTHVEYIRQFCGDKEKIVSVRDRELEIWGTGDGKLMRTLPTGVKNIWRVAYDRRFCVVAGTNDEDNGSLQVWDFGGNTGVVGHDEADSRESCLAEDDMEPGDSEEEDGGGTSPAPSPSPYKGNCMGISAQNRRGVKRGGEDIDDVTKRKDRRR